MSKQSGLFLFIILLGVGVNSYGITAPKSGSVSGDFEVIRPYKPVLAEANKQREDPSFSENKVYFPKMKYAVPDKKVEVPPYVETLPKIKYNHPLIGIPAKNIFLSAGFGNFKSITSDVAFNSGDMFKNVNIGLLGNGFMRERDNEFLPYHDVNTSFHSTYFGRRIQVKSKINFLMRENSYWGFVHNEDKDALVLNKIESQRWQQIGGIFELDHRPNVENQDLSYGSVLNIYQIKEISKLSENALKIQGTIRRGKDSFLGAKVDVEYNFFDIKTPIGISNLQNTQNLTYLRLTPQLTIKKNGFRTAVGLNLISHNYTAIAAGQQKNIQKILPNVMCEMTLFSGLLKVFSGFRGDYFVNTVQSVLNQNPFIYKIDSLKATKQNLVLNIGAKGVLFPNVSFLTTLDYKFVDDLQTFILDKQLDKTMLFVPYYVSGITKVLDLRMELHGDFEERLYFQLGLMYHQYTTPAVENAWFLSPLTSVSSLKYYSKNKNWSIGTNLNYIAGTVGGIRTTNSKITLQETTSFMNIDVKFTHKIYNNFDVFLNIDNILNQQYEQFLVNPKYATMIYGGLSVVF